MQQLMDVEISSDVDVDKSWIETQLETFSRKVGFSDAAWFVRVAQKHGKLHCTLRLYAGDYEFYVTQDGFEEYDAIGRALARLQFLKRKEDAFALREQRIAATMW